MEPLVKVNWFNTLLATCISFLLAWWLWSMGRSQSDSLLLSVFGGVVMEIGFVGGIGLHYRFPRSGSQAKIVFLFLALAAFVGSFVYSFYSFSAAAYCIPMGILVILCAMSALRVIKTGE